MPNERVSETDLLKLALLHERSRAAALEGELFVAQLRARYVMSPLDHIDPATGAIVRAAVQDDKSPPEPPQ